MQKRIIRDEPLPQAFACANDQTAGGRHLRTQWPGSTSPEDWSVTGFDDITLTDTSILR